MHCLQAQSHSLRSAWIEIEITTSEEAEYIVALLTECVDRNPDKAIWYKKEKRRTPYGVRG